MKKNLEGHILVTGASGYVGQHLAPALVEAGYEVAGTFFNQPIELEGVSTFPIDLSDPLAVYRVIRDMKPKVVIHCAGATKLDWCEENRFDAENSNILSTRNFITAIEELAPDTPLIYLSTDLVFDGEAAPYREAAPPKPKTVYGSQKFEAESLVRMHSKGTILRSSLVYGPPVVRRGSFVSWIVDGLTEGEEITLFEDEWRTPIFIDDLIKAIETLLKNLDKIPGKKFHAAGPDTLSRVEMGELICKQFKLDKSKIVTKSREEVESPAVRVKDVSLKTTALTKLGWKSIKFKTGIKKTHERWKQQEEDNDE